MTTYLGGVALNKRMTVNEHFNIMWKKAIVPYPKEPSYHLCSRAHENHGVHEDGWFLCFDSKHS
jgi:hypothetical protein